MRSSLAGLVVAATATLVPNLAPAGNQEIADRIAANLRKSGRLSDYKIGVTYQDQTAWLTGRVRNQQQMNSALKLVFRTPEVARVVNNLTTGPGVGAQPLAAPPATATRVTNSTLRFAKVKDTSSKVPLASGAGENIPGRRPVRGQRVASSYTPEPVQPAAATVPVVPQQPLRPSARRRIATVPVPVAFVQPGGPMPAAQPAGGPIPMYTSGAGGRVAPARYDQPHMPNYAWPGYAAYPNYAAVTYPRQYSPTAWPFIGPFYPYPQVPLGWRKVTLEWDDGWWMLDFKDEPARWCRR